MRLQGVISAFDSFSVELRRGPTAQLLYKHAISTIAPATTPEEFETDPSGRNAGTDLQDRFLAGVTEGKEAVSLYLVNGVMLDGRVEGFDQYVVLLERAGIAQMVYKHAISTLQPAPNAAPAEVMRAEPAESDA